MVGPTRPQFVLFGSSIVQMSYGNNGWGAILTDLYSRKADILLRGYAGWNSRRALQILDRVFPKDAAIQPSLVIVYFGGNDSIHPHPTGLGPHVPLPEYIDNMTKIALHLKSLSDTTRIIFLSPPPVNEDQMRKDLRDGIHLSSEGSKIVVKEILKVIEEVDWEPNLNWKIMPSEFSEDSPYDPVSPAGVNLNISNSNSTFHGTMMNSFDF
ncbi:GDSL esterase/lipase CPRD49-like isoform X4 [Mercurialis annua]|uniref:GDSL esterase/lipase CPRD49-like isoform X4 n=1 Tax=Mercurialis annua TaxID=3986 RepID=UPI0021608B08|nr:GDSL esterase/lipase CPRD49-like isoform X4 [Mercurialis annua]